MFPFMMQSGRHTLSDPMPLLLGWNDPEALTGASLPSLKKPWWLTVGGGILSIENTRWY